MAQREAAKEENRAKIKDAAAAIIRDEGMDQLTMRRLAEAAGVSLRTPYNLFGSKTDILFALLEDAITGLAQGLWAENKALVVQRLFSALEELAAYIGGDEAFYQEIYWGIMASDQVEIRRTGYERIIALTQWAVAAAISNKELSGAVEPEDFGELIGIQMLSVFGMWASGYFDSKECAAHVRRSLSASLYLVATKKSKVYLADTFGV